MSKLENPFKPGAGLFPPYLAGREKAIAQCVNLFEQTPISRNIIITGLRGVGKTVLLTKLKDIAREKDYYWCGTDMSESAAVNEETIALRLLTDLSVITSTIPIESKISMAGFGNSTVTESRLGFKELIYLYQNTPGLASDKLKNVLEKSWQIISRNKLHKGILFAYDEVQTIKDHAESQQYPLSLVLDVFQSFQRKQIPFMLLLTGLPTLFPLLIAARTYSERMFDIVTLERLNGEDSKAAIEKPIRKQQSQLGFSEKSIQTIIEVSGGYPYFIQFICKEVFDSFIRQIELGSKKPNVPIDEIIRKLDTDFFSGRWARLSDRQRDLLLVVASLENCKSEFTVKDVMEKSKEIGEKPFGSSHITQMFDNLQEKGIVYKNRHGKYSFAVPLFGEFILRQSQ